MTPADVVHAILVSFDWVVFGYFLLVDAMLTLLLLSAA